MSLRGSASDMRFFGFAKMSLSRDVAQLALILINEGQLGHNQYLYSLITWFDVIDEDFRKCYISRGQHLRGLDVKVACSNIT